MRSAEQKNTTPIFPLCLMITALALWVGLNQCYRIENTGQHPTDSGPSTVFYPKQVYQALSLGYPQVFADWFWIQAMQFPFDPKIQSSSAHVTAPNAGHLRLVTELDPLFFEYYYSGGNELTVVRRDPESALDLVARGREWYRTGLPRMPESFRKENWTQAWGLSVLAGYIWLFEKNDLGRAAEVFRDAATLPGAPQYLTYLANRLNQPGGVYEVGYRLVEAMLNGASDLEPEKKVRLEAERDSLFLGRFLYELRARFQTFRQRRSGTASQAQPSRVELQSAWQAFLHETGKNPTDPRGGRLYLDESGLVQTTTPRLKVFNLE